MTKNATRDGSVCSEVMVSVICKTYNHEHFIRKALDGFVMQKTTFPYEVIVHDDASTDATADIIREYERKYPNIIKPIYQKENTYSRAIPVMHDYILPKCRGKYLAWCEGDDYWTDPCKLQIQVDAMEMHSNCTACMSKVELIKIDDSVTGRYLPELSGKSRVLKSDEYLSYTIFPKPNLTLPWQISGMIMNKQIYMDFHYDNSLDYKSIFRKIKVGDISLFLYVGQIGDVYYIDRVMSRYRTGNPISFVGKTNATIEGRIINYSARIEAFESFDAATDYYYHNQIIKHINNCKFLMAYRKHDIRAMKRKEYREFYNKMNLRYKAATYLFSVCPWIEKPFRKWISHYRLARSN